MRGKTPPLPDQDAENGWTLARLQNALNWAQAEKGQANVEKMKNLLSREITTQDGLYSSYTIYQIVAVPETLTLWLRAPDHFEWQKVSLRALFD